MRNAEGCKLNSGTAALILHYHPVSIREGETADIIENTEARLKMSINLRPPAPSSPKHQPHPYPSNGVERDGRALRATSTYRWTESCDTGDASRGVRGGRRLNEITSSNMCTVDLLEVETSTVTGAPTPTEV